MSDAPKPLSPDHDAIESMAADWLAERDFGFTAERAAEFARWQDADPRHAAAVAMLAASWALLEQMPALHEDAALQRRIEALRPTAAPVARIVRFPRALRWGLAVAACLAVAYGVWRLRPSAAEDLHSATYATAAGDFRRVTLPDQSVVDLNADTQLRLEFSRASRHVALARGEAYFTVTKNPARPFVVSANGVEVRAVGTAFNVRLADSAVEVLVTEGRVQVGRNLGTAATSPILQAGERAVVATGAEPQVTATATPALRAALAWQNPRFEFANTALAEVVTRFNRHNRLQLEIGDPELRDLLVAGTFHADQVESFVGLFERSGDFAVERQGAEKIVLRKPAR